MASRTKASRTKASKPKVTKSKAPRPEEVQSPARDFITAPFLDDVFGNRLLSTLEAEGVGCVALAQPSSFSMVPASGVQVISRTRRGRKVSMRGNKGQVVARWPAEHQIALSLPYACFVFDGEADFSIGDAIVRCSSNRLILIAPGTPISDGSQPHWEREGIENAHSDILWMKFHPFGVECHTCHTRGAAHYGGGYGERNFITDRRLFGLVEMLLEELQYQRSDYEKLSNACLVALAALLKRHVEQEETLPRMAFFHAAPQSSNSAAPEPEHTIRRIKEYIHNNLGNSFTLQDIARATYISRSRLAMLFHQRTGQTVWEYVTALRFREAKAMLTETEMPIENIARLIGFPNPSHFSTRFSRAEGLSPSHFRLQSRRGNKSATEGKHD